MNHKRIIPSSSPVTTINVAGKAHHYFHSDVLGGCRAILISPDENLPRSTPPPPLRLSKGDRLEMLMNCSARLHKRWQRYYHAIYELPENDYKGRNAAFARLERIHKATSRLSRKIQFLLLDS